MAGNIGMMNEAYFLPKAVLLEWVNNFLQLRLEKVEQMATGACYCNLFDALHPRTVAMNRVDFGVKYDYEYAKNWKLLQNAFLKVGIKKQIPVERLTKARYQDNLEFLQWFYKYAHDTYPGDCDNPDYDAKTQRNRSKGGREFNNLHNKNMNNLNQRNNNNRRGRGKENMKNYNGSGSGSNGAPRSARGHHGPYHNNKQYNNNNNSNNSGNGNVGSSASVGSMRGHNNNNNNNNYNNNGRRRGGGGPNQMRNNSVSSMNSINSMNHNNSNNNNSNNNNNNNDYEQLRMENNKLMSQNEKLKKQIETLNHDHVELRNVAKDIEKERDFYFNKVLQVESICKQHEDQSFPLLKSIYDILYQNDETADGGNNGTNNDDNNNSNNGNTNNNNDDTNNINNPDGAAMNVPLPNEEQQQEQVQGEMVNNFGANGTNKMEDVMMDGQSMTQNNVIAM